MKFIVALIFIVIGIGFSACATSKGPLGVAKINTSADGLALRGYDTVAYFTAESAVKGDPKYEFVWNSAKWIFSSQENMEKFMKNPEAYAPQFGGYCSYAVSHGYTADGDPEQWKVVDNKLYVNYSAKAKKAWEKDQDKFINDGEKNWAEFQTKAPEHK
jgi:hypothetical protein